ncbi:CD83 antigen-like isoform X2 [Scyliorhinus canicula]|uniref:CD83 antigen-like isoform X2 n=1 Tax=Scyliorhinus canicula TaxID=7830 RepID=UPI0018F3D992|nr:CD83 antigen-like isoform X2 [Scyliorhinus canicula]
MSRKTSHHSQHWFLGVQALMFLGAECISEVAVKCGETARLPCKADFQIGLQYRAISWYKITDNGVGLIGIVRKDFRENITRKYLGFNGTIELDSARPYYLIIPSVSREDFGTYQCSLSAPLGEQNKQADVGLRERGIQFERWWIIVPIVLMILGFIIFIGIYTRKYNGPSDYKKCNNEPTSSVGTLPCV